MSNNNYAMKEQVAERLVGALRLMEQNEFKRAADYAQAAIHLLDDMV